LNGDGQVDMADVSIVAEHWKETSCDYPGWCEGADVDHDGDVDLADVLLVSEYWLWQRP